MLTVSKRSRQIREALEAILARRKEQACEQEERIAPKSVPSPGSSDFDIANFHDGASALEEQVDRLKVKFKGDIDDMKAALAKNSENGTFTDLPQGNNKSIALQLCRNFECFVVITDIIKFCKLKFKHKFA